MRPTLSAATSEVETDRTFGNDDFEVTVVKIFDFEVPWRYNHRQVAPEDAANDVSPT